MNKQNRRIVRPRAFKMAKLFLKRNGSYYDCRLADLTSRGARVKFDKVSLLEDRVEFILKPEDVPVSGRIAWRGDNEFGINFDKPLAWLEKHDVAMSGA